MMEPTTAILTGAGINAASSMLSNLFNHDTVNETNRRNYEMSKEFAQNSVQWRVADARKAGINPLAALGMQASYAPSAMASSSEYGGGIAAAGQATARAMEQMAELSLKEKMLDLQGKQLDNEAKAALLATPKAEDITKTAGNFSIGLVNGPQNTMFSEKTAPQYMLEPVTSGYVRYIPREGSLEHERRSESLAASYLGGMGDLITARAEAAKLNRADSSANWVAVQQPSTGAVALYNMNDPVARENASFFDNLSGYGERFYRWLGIVD
jgi:hypothetical protein